MAGLNKVMIIGNLGADPEMRYTADGAAVTNFNVAASRRYTSSDGEQKEETEWFRVVAFRKLGELCNQYLQKGRRVYVEGRLQTRSWEGQDGQKRYTTEVIAGDVQFLDSRPGGAPRPDDQDAAMDLEPEDVPFE